MKDSGMEMRITGAIWMAASFATHDVVSRTFCVVIGIIATALGIIENFVEKE